MCQGLTTLRNIKNASEALTGGLSMAKHKVVAGFLVILALFIASPLDDLLFISIFGYSLFGLDSFHFWLLVLISGVVSLFLFSGKGGKSK
jgi:hypothetical protein